MQRTKRLVRLALTLALAYGVVLTGTAAAARATPPQPAADQILKLTPAAAVAQVGKPIRYTAVAVDDNGGRDDLTTLTVFRFSDPGLCRQTDKAAEVICDKPGAYTVTGEVDLPRLTSDPVDLEVVLEPASPSIESVDRTPPRPTGT